MRIIAVSARPTAVLLHQFRFFSYFFECMGSRSPLSLSGRCHLLSALFPFPPPPRPPLLGLVKVKDEGKVVRSSSVGHKLVTATPFPLPALVSNTPPPPSCLEVFR